MRDVVFVAVVIAFFAIAAAYVRACGVIIGKDELVPTDSETDDMEAEAGIVNR
jgi:hypothetical protein